MLVLGSLGFWVHNSDEILYYVVRCVDQLSSFQIGQMPERIDTRLKLVILLGGCVLSRSEQPVAGSDSLSEYATVNCVVHNIGAS